MKTMGISQFKAHALKVINDVAKSQETIVILKRGKPLAQIAPYRHSESEARAGKLADTLLFEEDIISPLGEEIWEVSR